MTRLIYVIYASIHIILLTLTGSLLFSIVLCVLCTAILLRLGQNKYIVPVVMLATVSIVAVWIYDSRQASLSFHDHYVGTGVISDYYRTDRYIVDIADSSYILSTENKFHLGDEIFFQAYDSPRYASGLQFYDNHWQQILSGGYVFDYAKWQHMRGIVGTLYSTQNIVVDHRDLTLRQKIRQGLRDRIAEHDSSDTSAIMLGILLGDRSLLQADTYQGMIDSGFVHLIAVSGGNIAFLVIVLQLILFFVPYYARLCIIAACILIYARLCGGDSSVLRATLMGVLSIVALFAGRPTYIRRLLGISRVGLLLYNPYFLVYDIGFSFSFAAIIGIILVQEYVNRFELNTKRQKLLVGYMSATIGASLGVMPFLLFFTYQINILSILTNIVISPGVGVLTLASIGKSMIPNWTIRQYPIQRMLDLAQWTAIHGIYIIVDRVWFASAVVLLAIAYFIYTMHNHKQHIETRE